MTKAELRDELENCKVSLEAEKKKREELVKQASDIETLRELNLGLQMEVKELNQNLYDLRKNFESLLNENNMYKYVFGILKKEMINNE